MPERWVVLPEGSPPEVQADFAKILAVHAALLHTGKVLYLGGSRPTSSTRRFGVNRRSPPRQHAAVGSDHQREFQNCLHHSRRLHTFTICFVAVTHLLADGRLLVGGGTSAYPPSESDHHHEHYRGSRRSSIFDPVSRSWTTAAEMIEPPPQDVEARAQDLIRTEAPGGGGRWYPTWFALPNRAVAAFGGESAGSRPAT